MWLRSDRSGCTTKHYGPTFSLFRNVAPVYGFLVWKFYIFTQQSQNSTSYMDIWWKYIKKIHVGGKINAFSHQVTMVCPGFGQGKVNFSQQPRGGGAWSHVGMAKTLRLFANILHHCWGRGMGPSLQRRVSLVRGTSVACLGSICHCYIFPGWVSVLHVNLSFLHFYY